MTSTERAKRIHAMMHGGLWKLGPDEWGMCEEPQCGICAALELVLSNVERETCSKMSRAVAPLLRRAEMELRGYDHTRRCTECSDLIQQLRALADELEVT